MKAYSPKMPKFCCILKEKGLDCQPALTTMAASELLTPI